MQAEPAAYAPRLRSRPTLSRIPWSRRPHSQARPQLACRADFSPGAQLDTAVKRFVIGESGPSHHHLYCR